MSAAPASAVVGAGMWGTTLAILLAARGPVTLLARDAEQADRLVRDHGDPRSLPGVTLPDAVTITADPAALREASGLVVMAVPAGAMRTATERAAPHIASDAVIVSVAKGIEPVTLKRMSEVIIESAPSAEGRVAALSGPNLAPEIARGLPAAAVVAAPRDPISEAVVERLASPTLRLYRNRDLLGVELAGALKNIVAIVAGAVDALGLGDNAKAAITTRGLAEITRLGVAMGANPLTFAGLAGIGDILATCSSPLSRNHRLGAEVATGRPWREVAASLPGVAEGPYTVVAAAWPGRSSWRGHAARPRGPRRALRGQGRAPVPCRPHGSGVAGRARRTWACRGHTSLSEQCFAQFRLGITIPCQDRRMLGANHPEHFGRSHATRQAAGHRQCESLEQSGCRLARHVDRAIDTAGAEHMNRIAIARPAAFDMKRLPRILFFVFSETEGI